MVNPKELGVHLEGLKTENPTWRLMIGGKSPEELQRELRRGGFRVSFYAHDMLESPDFTTRKKPEKIDLIRLKVSDLGFQGAATTDQIYLVAQAQEYELCPSEVGPHLRLAYQDQPGGEWLSIGMKQITDCDGSPCVFALARPRDGLWVVGTWATPTSRWSTDSEFVFRFRPDTKA